MILVFFLVALDTVATETQVIRFIAVALGASVFVALLDWRATLVLIRLGALQACARPCAVIFFPSEAKRTMKARAFLLIFTADCRVLVVTFQTQAKQVVSSPRLLRDLVGWACECAALRLHITARAVSSVSAICVSTFD